MMKHGRCLWGVAVVAGVLSSGCARYQYVLVEPGDRQQTISKEGSVVPWEPLEYQFATVRDHLAVKVMNRSAEPLRLAGEKSYVVDPAGATHPLPGGTIAPNAHIGLLLPPAPILYRSSPRFSFGFGFGHLHSPYHHYHSPYHHFYSGLGYDPWYYGPTEFYAVNPPHHWEWKIGEARMRFVYEGTSTNVEHNFTFDRQRVK
jgi:hypothetical protein